MTELVVQSIKTKTSSSSPQTVDDDEKEIIAYVSGFVLFRCQNIFSKDSVCLNVVKKCIDKNGSFNKLIQIKSRGGLCFPSDDIVNFCCLCECVFRETFTGVQYSLSSFISPVCSREDIISLFLNCTADDEDCENTLPQETVLLSFLQLFFKVRTHAKCRSIMETYLGQTKKLRKQKALRKSLT